MQDDAEEISLNLKKHYIKCLKTRLFYSPIVVLRATSLKQAHNPELGLMTISLPAVQSKASCPARQFRAAGFDQSCFWLEGGCLAWTTSRHNSHMPREDIISQKVVTIKKVCCIKVFRVFGVKLHNFQNNFTSQFGDMATLTCIFGNLEINRPVRTPGATKWIPGSTKTHGAAPGNHAKPLSWPKQ